MVDEIINADLLMVGIAWILRIILLASGYNEFYLYKYEYMQILDIFLIITTLIVVIVRLILWVTKIKSDPGNETSTNGV